MKKLFAFLGWLALALAGIFLAVQLSFLARVWWWRDHNPASTAFMESSLEGLRAKQPEGIRSPRPGRARRNTVTTGGR